MSSVNPSARRGRPPADSRDPAASRRKLLDAAATEFADRGYQAATVDAIVQRAGLSKGTFYWTFATKAELFVALLEDRLDQPVEQVIESMQDTSLEESPAPAISRGLAALFSDDPEVLRLLYEYWAAATRDDEHSERYLRRHTVIRAELAAALAARHEEAGVPPTMDVTDLAEAFIALALGLGMSALIDETAVSEDLFGEIASLVYAGMVHRNQCEEEPR